MRRPSEAEDNTYAKCYRLPSVAEAAFLECVTVAERSRGPGPGLTLSPFPKERGARQEYLIAAQPPLAKGPAQPYLVLRN
jgi:hypothetical protein